MKTPNPNQPPKKTVSRKKALDPREYPLARDARGKASREEVRAQTPRLSAPRQSLRPVKKSQ